MKSGGKLPSLLADLKRRKLLGRAMLVQNCGMPGERIHRNLENLESAGIDGGYFSLVIIKAGDGGGA